MSITKYYNVNDMRNQIGDLNEPPWRNLHAKIFINTKDQWKAKTLIYLQWMTRTY